MILVILKKKLWICSNLNVITGSVETIGSIRTTESITLGKWCDKEYDNSNVPSSRV